MEREHVWLCGVCAITCSWTFIPSFIFDQMCWFKIRIWIFIQTNKEKKKYSILFTLPSAIRTIQIPNNTDPIYHINSAQFFIFFFSSLLYYLSQSEKILFKSTCKRFIIKCKIKTNQNTTLHYKYHEKKNLIL